MTAADPGSRLRRARIFFPVFVLAAVAALAYVFAQPPVYVAAARVQVVLPAEKRADEAAVLAKQAQTLTSAAMLESVWKRLGGTGTVGAAALRGMVSAEPVPGAGAIELRAEGSDRAALLRVLAAWIDAWRQGDGRPGERAATKVLDEARAAAERLAQDVADRREAIGEIRAKFGIDPAGAAVDAGEASRLKELGDELGQARGREADAEARLTTLRESAATGLAPGVAETVVLSQLEKQAAEARAGIRNLEQDYTPLYLEHDPRYKSLRADLARLEREMEQERRAATQQALQRAEAAAAGARKTVADLQDALAAVKRVADEQASRVAEQAALAADLAKLEESHAGARERVAQLEKEGADAGPELKVVSQPAVPDRPDRPDYWRDGLLGAIGAALLGWMAVWLAGFFRQGGQQPGVAGTQPGPVPGAADSAHRPVPAASSPPSAMGGARELSAPEVRALWRAAAPAARIAIAGLLGGLSLEELAALHYAHVDFDGCYVRVPGISGRSCTLRAPLRRLLIERRAAKGGEPPLSDAQGEPLAAPDIDRLIARAAQEAGVANAGEVTAETLRHTYFAWLVRQGARFAEIGEFIGRISPSAHREYLLLAPPGPGRPMEEIDPVLPVLRELE